MRNYFLLLGFFFAALPLAAATYSYDAAGRVVKIDYGSSGAVVYSYDGAGNLVSRALIPASGGAAIQSVNTSSGGSDIAQNTYIEIYGTNLVPANTPAAGVIWSTAPSFASGQLPTQLNGVSVTVNGKAAYVYFFCSAATSTCKSDQINVLTPLDSTTGPVSIVVTNGTTASPPFTANMTAVNPTFLRFSGTTYVAATHSAGSLVGPTSLYPGFSTPAQPGETVVIYAVGLGQPSTPLVQGSAIQSGSLPTLPVCKVGANNATLIFAGISGAGLYQVNVTIPAGTPAGDSSITCTYDGAGTPAGNLITVQ